MNKTCKKDTFLNQAFYLMKIILNIHMEVTYVIRCAIQKGKVFIRYIWVEQNDGMMFGKQNIVNHFFTTVAGNIVS
jgi:hypothetical protein